MPNSYPVNISQIPPTANTDNALLSDDTQVSGHVVTSEGEALFSFEEIKRHLELLDYSKLKNRGYLHGYIDCLNDFSALPLHQRLQLENFEYSLYCRQCGVLLSTVQNNGKTCISCLGLGA